MLRVSSFKKFPLTGPSSQSMFVMMRWLAALVCTVLAARAVVSSSASCQRNYDISMEMTGEEACVDAVDASISPAPTPISTRLLCCLLRSLMPKFRAQRL